MSSSRGAFTLIEVMVCVVIGAVVFGAIIGFYSHATRMEMHGSQALDSLQQAQQLLGHLIDDVQAMALPPDGSFAECLHCEVDESLGELDLEFERWIRLGDDGSAGRGRVRAFRAFRRRGAPTDARDAPMELLDRAGGRAGVPTGQHASPESLGSSGSFLAEDRHGHTAGVGFRTADDFAALRGARIPTPLQRALAEPLDRLRGLDPV